MSKFFKATSLIVISIMMAAMGLAGCTTDRTPEVVNSVNSIEITNGNINAIEGDLPIELIATVEVTGDLVKTVNWSSSDETVATVTSTGILNVISEGIAQITATAKADTTKKATISVTVAHKFIPHNGGFEMTNDWGVWSNNDSSVESISISDMKYDGEKSLKAVNGGVIGTSPGNYTVIWQGVALDVDDADLEIGKYYKISAYVYVEEESNIKAKISGESVITEGDVKAVVVQSNSFRPTINNEWQKIETQAFCIPDANTLNIKVEFTDAGTIYIDNIDIVEVDSNNTDLTELKVDGEALSGFTNSIDTYNIIWTKTTNPVVTAVVKENSSLISIIDATVISSFAEVTVTAKDGTIRVIKINFNAPEVDDLMSISINGLNITEFEVDRTNYYRLILTDVVPVVTAEAVDTEAMVDINDAQSLPGTTTITVNNNIVYTIYFDLKTEDRLMISYPDTDFDGLTTTVGQSWGFDRALITNSNIANSGKGAIQETGYGSGGWVGFDLAGNDNGYPEKGNVLKLGAWVYVSPLSEGAVTGNLLLEIHAKDSDTVLVSQQFAVTNEMIGNWTYIETDYSIAVPENAGYIQLVVKNFTGTSESGNSVVYFDNLILKHQ